MLQVRQAKKIGDLWIVDNAAEYPPVGSSFRTGDIFTADFVYAPGSGGEAWAIDTKTGHGACITLGSTQHMESV
jgi:hypothetical protein